MLTPEQARKISLIEVLLEEAEEQRPGMVQAPPEQAALLWSEDEIRRYFNEQLSATGTSSAIGGGNAPLDGAETSRLLNGPVGQSLTPPRPPPAAPVSARCSPELLARWFPGLPLSGTATPNPRARILAFHSAGNAEDMWTSEGTGPRRSPSPLLEWCRVNRVELLAVQMPGRGSRAREPFITNAQAAAQALLPVVTPLLESSAGVSYAVLSHSFGCWVAFELLRAVRAAGLPQPRVWCLSAMPYPDVPYDKRPWRRQRTLDDTDFKEEMRGWDVNEVVFTRDMWQLYEPILRADCTVFDEYELQPDASYDRAVRQASGGNTVEGPPPLEPFDFPISAFWGNQDRRISRGLVAPWARYTRGGFTLREIAGNHLWPINNRQAKATWLTELVSALETALV
ncbi:hypothetical protein PLESTB_001028800 [Pleodorina starrii]|uniref:Thioesterase domain-containing protein n=1 Tax=Pleodorina starrii TaxID=330485 RepID=A0A9W6BPB6_9CHLO|nr:hypothetical protein PLESTB_001028800 [Pleodorina starrii]